MRNEFRPATDLDGDVIRISPNDLTLGANIVKKNNGDIQVYFMRAFAEGGDLSVEASNWTLKEENDVKRGVMDILAENHPIPRELFDMERSLSHICSDASGLEKNNLAQRVIKTRDGVRNTLRKKGYKGTF